MAVTDKLLKLEAIDQIGAALQLYYQKKEDGKSLVDDDEIAKLENIEANAQENVIEEIEVNGTAASIVDKKAIINISGGVIDSISVNGTPQTIDQNKNVDITVPTKVSDLQNDSGFITQEADPTVPNHVKSITQENITDWNNKSDFSGDYNDLTNKPTIPDVSNFITKDVNDLTYYELATATGNNIEISINSSTYVMTLNLKNSAGTVISTGTVDLPLESVVVGGTYDDATKKVILTLQSGSTIEFSVADLVSGLQTELNANNKLASDYVDDTNQVNKFVTVAEKTAWNGKEDPLNKVTTITSSSTNTQYPSALAVYNLFNSIVNGNEVAY